MWPEDPLAKIRCLRGSECCSTLDYHLMRCRKPKIKVTPQWPEPLFTESSTSRWIWASIKQIERMALSDGHMDRILEATARSDPDQLLMPTIAVNFAADESASKTQWVTKNPVS